MYSFSVFLFLFGPFLGILLLFQCSPFSVVFDTVPVFVFPVLCNCIWKAQATSMKPVITLELPPHVVATNPRTLNFEIAAATVFCGQKQFGLKCPYNQARESSHFQKCIIMASYYGFQKTGIYWLSIIHTIGTKSWGVSSLGTASTSYFERALY